jgi:hypothetical protein
MTEWCGPTTRLSAKSLVELRDRARRASCAPAPRKPSDSQAPLADPWFEDSAPQQAPAPQPPAEKPRERRERTVIPKLITRAVYPVYRGREHVIVRAMLGLGLIGAAVAAIALF